MKRVMNKNYYTIQDLCNTTGIPYNTLHRWVKRDQMEMVKIGLRYYFTESQFNKIIESIA